MTIEKLVRIRRAIIKVIVIFFLSLIVALLVLMAVQIYKKREQEKRNTEYKQNYPHEISAYLMDKYGKSFYIYPDYKTYPSGPIPFKRSYTPYIYVVREENEDGYLFHVHVYPESEYDMQIDEIMDNYCWKFLNIMTKEWFRTEMEGILPQEYKFVMLPVESRNKDLKPDLSLEEYYKILNDSVYLSLYIIIPKDDLLQNIEDTESELIKVLEEFYKNNPNVRIDLSIFQAKSYYGYDRIDESVLENTPFYLHKEGMYLRDLADDIETIMEIEVGQEY